MLFKPPIGTPLNRNHPMSVGLTGCWLFNEGSGKYIHNYSGNNIYATTVNISDPPVPTEGWVAGPHGGALAMAGGNKYITTTTQIITKPTTIIVWAWINSFPIGGDSVGMLLQSGSFYWGFNGTTKKLEVYAGSWQQGNINVTFGALTQFIIVGTSTGTKMYMDAIECYSGAVVFFDGSAVTTIGARESSLNPNFTVNGAFESILIYDREFSAAEVNYSFTHPYAMFDDYNVDFFSTAGGGGTILSPYYYNMLLAGSR